MKRIVAIIAVLILQLGALNAYAESDKMVSTADFTYKSFDAVADAYAFRTSASDLGKITARGGVLYYGSFCINA